MQLLAPVLLMTAAVALFATSQRVRAGKLQRLQRLVAFGHAPLAAAPAAEFLRLAEYLLPQAFVRQLRLLGIEPNLHNAGLAAGAGGLPILVMAVVSGPLPTLALAAGLLLAAVIALHLLAAHRVAAIGALLPGFFDRVRQLLIIGNSLPTAFSRAVQGSPPRLTGFFAPTLRRLGNGASFSESIQQCAEDIDLYEMRLFAAAVATNMRFGGSLTHSLSNLVGYLRKRASIERELRASTAQIRASAWVLGLLPMVVAGFIVMGNRDYAGWFVTHPTGKRMLAYCVVSQIVGVCLMRAVVRTKF